MISYAQNGEDVVLDRALAGIVGAAGGFYVDVGASSPDAASVTRHFYDNGWRGINVEPRRQAWAELCRRRPEDLNLQVAIGAENGSTTLYEVVEDPDLSTIDRDDLDYLVARGYTWTEDEVPVRTLDSVLEGAGAQDISFLKIDAEGAEEAVLRGLDMNRRRPKVIVIEAIRPWSRDRVDHLWRDILEDSDYHEALFDGVNLFFVPSELLDRRDLFAPASALDRYRTAETVALERELAWHRSRLPAAPASASPARRVPPPAPGRFAVVGAPFSGGRWAAQTLAAATGSPMIEAGHPSLVDWEAMPDSFVLLAGWARTPLLQRALTTAGVKLVSPARHPIEVVMAAHPAAAGFAEWALGPEALALVSTSAGWWSDPAVARLRYEEVRLDPRRSAARLLARWRLPEVDRLDAPDEPEVAVDALDPELRARLEARFAAVADRLGHPSA